MTLFFVLCADDYGMTPGVSRGILEAAAAGRISASSAMTSCPDWPRAAAAWRRAAPPADLGLHINLTLGNPLGPMPTVAPDGRLPPIRWWIRGSPLADVEIAAEIGRQIAAFTAQTGAPPSHVDGHQHVHALPAVRAALFAALRANGLGGMRLRDSGDGLIRILRRRASLGKALAVAGLTRGFARQARAQEFQLNDGFAGFSAFDPAADIARQMARFLHAPGHDHLVMCHPGYADEALRQCDPVTDARETELRFLLSREWPALLARCGARLRGRGGLSVH